MGQQGSLELRKGIFGGILIIKGATWRKEQFVGILSYDRLSQRPTRVFDRLIEAKPLHYIISYTFGTYCWRFSIRKLSQAGRIRLSNQARPHNQ
eukprot:scaffold660791_cov57-Prasinocladus_malaysianus.AAC.1